MDKQTQKCEYAIHLLLTNSVKNLQFNVWTFQGFFTQYDFIMRDVMRFTGCFECWVFIEMILFNKMMLQLYVWYNILSVSGGYMHIVARNKSKVNLVIFFKNKIYGSTSWPYYGFFTSPWMISIIQIIIHLYNYTYNEQYNSIETDLLFFRLQRTL